MLLDLTLFDAVEVGPCITWFDEWDNKLVESYDTIEEAQAEESCSVLRLDSQYWSVFLRYKDGGDMHGRECLADFPNMEQAETIGGCMQFTLNHIQMLERAKEQLDESR